MGGGGGDQPRTEVRGFLNFSFPCVAWSGEGFEVSVSCFIEMSRTDLSAGCPVGAQADVFPSATRQPPV